MTRNLPCKEVSEYLSRFELNEDFAVVIVDLKSRLHYRIDMLNFCTDSPTLFIEIRDPQPLDEAEQG
jgi:hypothetical protein